MRIISFLLFLTLSIHAQISPKMYEKLVKIEEQISLKKYANAQKQLQKALGLAKTKIDKGYIYQTIGYLALAQNNHKKAIKYLTKTLNLKILNPKKQARLTLSIAQLHLANKNYKSAQKLLVKYLLQNPKDDKALFFLSQIQYMAKSYKKSTKNILKAIEYTKKPNVRYYELLFSNYYSTKSYVKAIDVIKILISLNSKKKRYYFYLSSMYALTKDYMRSASALELARTKKLLNEKELSNLAQMYLSLKAPIKCLNILANVKEPNEDTHLQCLLLARELKDAKKLLESIQTKKPRYALLKARLHLMDEQYDKAQEAYALAVKKIKPKIKRRAMLELAYVLFMQKKYKKARALLLVLPRNKTTKGLLKAIKNIKASIKHKP